ncbi:MAG: hypothetical protein ACRC8S_11800 [Fimbriiglobus sp.]
MTRRTFFFLTHVDTLAWLLEFEKSEKLAYSVIGSFTESVRVYRSASDIEGLGVSRWGDSAREMQYLILPHSVEFETRTLLLSSGGTKTLLYPDTNPGSVLINPGGILEQQAVILGELATTLKDKASISLYNSLRVSLRGAGELIGDTVVGQDAATKARSGYRLVAKTSAPVDCDFLIT